MAAKNHITKVEAMQSIIFRIIVNVLGTSRRKTYARNYQIPSMCKESQQFFDRYKCKKANHPNTLANTLYYIKYYVIHQKKTIEKVGSCYITHLMKL